MAALDLVFLLFLKLALGNELPGHMQPLGSHRPMEGEIERISHIPDPVTFYQDYVVPKRPVVFSAAIANTPPLTRWTDEYFKCVCVWGGMRVGVHVVIAFDSTGVSWVMCQ